MKERPPRGGFSFISFRSQTPYNSRMSSLRTRMASVVAAPAFTWAVTGLILLNAVTLGLQTSAAIMAQYGALLEHVDNIVIALFVAEIALRLHVHRLAFFKSGWNVFDFAIVGISLIPASGPFAIMRTLRVLRLLRLVSVVPRMRRVIDAMLDAIPGMGAVAAVMVLMFYIFAVMTTQVFGPAGGRMTEYYGSIGRSMWTLFGLMTLDGWNEVAADTLALFPHAWPFFVLFIIIMTFAVLNLFIGIIVDAMNIMHEQDGDTLAHRDHSEEMTLLRKIDRDLKKLHDEIAALKKRR